MSSYSREQIIGMNTYPLKPSYFIYIQLEHSLTCRNSVPNRELPIPIQSECPSHHLLQGTITPRLFLVCAHVHALQSAGLCTYHTCHGEMLCPPAIHQQHSYKRLHEPQHKYHTPNFVPGTRQYHTTGNRQPGTTCHGTTRSFVDFPRPRTGRRL